MPATKKTPTYDELMRSIEKSKHTPSQLEQLKAAVKAKLDAFIAKRNVPVQKRAAKEGDKILNAPVGTAKNEAGQRARVLTRAQQERALKRLEKD